jgi:hypothetical protein
MRARLTAARVAIVVAPIVGFAVLPWQAAAATAWWTPVALRGTTISSVSASGNTITVRTADGRTLRSIDAGASFNAVSGNPPLSPQNIVRSGDDTWQIDSTGHVLHSKGNSPLQLDPQTPDLGTSARLLAAPVARPGVVVAVARDNTVWRRGQDGDWQRALLLLPQGLLRGAPAVTSVTAFTQPLTASVYLSTDGYAVLISTDGGDDWIRAGPGLPDSVYSLSADAEQHAVYAATSDGLWMHVLQRLPSSPPYTDADLVWRWVGIVLVSLASAGAAAFGLLRLLPANQATPDLN